MVPLWLHIVSIVSLATGFLAAAAIALDEARHPQEMWIMNVVWPVTALFAPLVVPWLYFRYGRLATHERHAAAQAEGGEPLSKTDTPMWAMITKGTGHCGAGCTLGDICAEWLPFFFPIVAVWFGWHSIFDEKMFAVWIVDYLFAFGFGVAFQYFTIAPMRGLGVGEGIKQALKADTLSLTAWQIGMYGFMAIAAFGIFQDLIGARLEVPSPEFWLMMQIAMWCGFATAYPVNAWLIRKGIKEKM